MTLYKTDRNKGVKEINKVSKRGYIALCIMIFIFALVDIDYLYASEQKIKIGYVVETAQKASANLCKWVARVIEGMK